MSSLLGSGPDSKKTAPAANLQTRDAAPPSRDLRAAMVDALADILRDERRRGA